MAKLRNGIFGKSTNKLGGVVMSTWRGINVAREKVTPANPRTAAQTMVRTTFAHLVFIGRAIYPVFMTLYWNKLAQGKPYTGWSKFMGTNQKQLAGDESMGDLKLATGGLEGVKNPAISADTSTNKVTFTWDKDVISNGQATDKVHLHVYSKERKYLYTQSLPYSRTDELGVIDVPDLANIGDNAGWYITLQNTSGEFSTTQGQDLDV